MSSSALSDSFEYLCYGSTAIINSFTLTVRGSIFTLTVRGSTLDVYGRQIMTSKVEPRTARVNAAAWKVELVEAVRDSGFKETNVFLSYSLVNIQ